MDDVRKSAWLEGDTLVAKILARISELGHPAEDPQCRVALPYRGRAARPHPRKGGGLHMIAPNRTGRRKASPPMGGRLALTPVRVGDDETPTLAAQFSTPDERHKH